MLHATSITQLFPATQPAGNVIYIVEHYEVGKQCKIDKHTIEDVEEIIILTEPQLIAAIKFKDYGTTWITSHIIEIRYERPDYRETIKRRKNGQSNKSGDGVSSSPKRD